MIKIYIAFILAFFGLVTESIAQQYAPDYRPSLKDIRFQGTPEYYTSPELACDMADGKLGKDTEDPTKGVETRFFLSGPAYSAGSYYCEFKYRSNGGTTLTSRDVRFWCPQGGELRNDWCNNPPLGGVPPVNPCADKNPIIRNYAYGPKGPYMPPNNFAGCIVTPLEMLRCYKSATGTNCYWKVARTGEPYTGTDNTAVGGGSTDNTPPPTVPPPLVPSPPITPPVKPEICSTCRPCPAGTVQAGIGSDGVPMCVGTGTNPPPPPTTPTTTTNPPVKTTASDGTSTTTQVSTQPNKDGSTTTTTTTTVVKPDGTTTVTRDSVASNTASGSPGATDKPSDDDKYNLCKQNPNLSICRESSVSGTCGEISCVGDAIQCATLRAAAAMECKVRTDEAALKETPSYKLGQAALNGNDPLAETLPTVKNATVVGMPGMSDAGWLGAGQAFSDVSFSIQGHSITVPLNEWSGYLVGLRYALMVMASLISFRMLSGVILRE